ncbi:lipase secretion chaperone [Alkalimarinus coralli]|uniref:lipase secretion chaperone n=1 Tax=Alkalimarinus coralli TaxID=2935863 RepID=UPI00202B5972|nr:lipase secretion chaperone [Alkalimarinus coralli]
MNRLSIGLVVISIIAFSIAALFLSPFLSNQQEATTDNHHLSVLKEEARHANETLFESPTTKGITELHKPDSLRGINFQADFKVSESNNLIPNYAIRELFDHYLSTYGEVEIDNIIALIQGEINESLQEPAKSEALALLKRYIDYKIELAENNPELSLNTDDGASYLEKIISAQSALQSLRKDFFNQAEYESFFGLEDTQNAYMIEQIRINTDPTLSDEEKRERLEQANMLLPDELVERRNRVQRHAQLREQVTSIQAEGGSQEEVFRVREEALGSEAASALAQLDEQRQQWSQRLNNFSKERKSILDSSLSDQDKATSIDNLIAAHFDTSEQKRVRAIMNDGQLDSN